MSEIHSLDAAIGRIRELEEENARLRSALNTPDDGSLMQIQALQAKLAFAIEALEKIASQETWIQHGQIIDASNVALGMNLIANQTLAKLRSQGSGT